MLTNSLLPFQVILCRLIRTKPINFNCNICSVICQCIFKSEQVWPYAMMNKWTGRIKVIGSGPMIYNFQINMKRKQQASNIHLCLYQVIHCNSIQVQVSMVNRARLASTSQVSKKQLCPSWENFVTGKENLHGWNLQQNKVTDYISVAGLLPNVSSTSMALAVTGPMVEVVKCSRQTLFSFAHSFLGGKKSYFELEFSTFYPSPKVT